VVGRYPRAHLQTTGRIGGRTVRCLTAEHQEPFPLANEWRERDEHELRLLVARFADVPVPPPLWDVSFESGSPAERQSIEVACSSLCARRIPADQQNSGVRADEIQCRSPGIAVDPAESKARTCRSFRR
jgi:hypothetical protein